MNILTLPITAALALAVTPTLTLSASPRNLCAQGNFVYGSGGTTVDAYLQTSLDGGNTWTDIAEWHFTTASGRKVYNLNAQTPQAAGVTPTDGALAANTAQDGVLGPRFRVKYVTTGTYAGGTQLSIDLQSDQIASYP
jgi:hypothetical protein